MRLRKKNRRPASTVDLQTDRYSTAYLDRLSAGFLLLSQWFLALRPVPEFVWTRTGVNSLLIRFVQDMFNANAPLYLVTHAVLAFEKHYPHYHRKLAPTWASIRSWKLRSTFGLRVPMPPQVLYSLVLYAFLMGFQLDPLHSHLWLPFGIQLWMGYEGLLRPGELHKVTRRHLSLPSNAACSFVNCVMILISEPKNKGHFGRMQTAIVRHPSLIKWIEWLCTDLPVNARLNTMSLPVMRTQLKIMLRALGLQKLNLTLASLRSGKATALYTEGVSTDRIRFEGRWKSIHTLEHYVQEASAASVLNTISNQSGDLIHTLHANLHLLEHPPKLPWYHYFSRQRQLSKLANLSKSCRSQSQKFSICPESRR